MLRCYLTLKCNSSCVYCSANIPKLINSVKTRSISPSVWAEGINRRNRPTLLCGGEPFLYPYINELITKLSLSIRIEFYTNLGIDIRGFLEVAPKTYPFLISLHARVFDFSKWYTQVERLLDAGNSCRFHVVKQGNWVDRRDFLIDKGHKVTCCDDQNKYKKSLGAESNTLHPSVSCKSRYYVYGPDGYRYNCVTNMGIGGDFGRSEHISDADSTDWLSVENCTNFGFCAGCDNLHEGTTYE